ncbi:alpha/beta hydrolase [Stieleria sp. TO1_6]|nr:alpha/beta hydrolase [Stieleria tagensis]
MNRLLFLLMVVVAFPAVSESADDASVKTVRVWPGDPPAWTAPTAAEADTSGPDGRAVAGKPVIRLGNVSSPELHLYPATGAETTIVIAPGGGFSILAWDLEGTEIARWFQANGISAAVLKYRVPTRDEDPKWLPPVQDLQRSVSLIRSGAVAGFPTQQVGVMGFSAGGNTAAHAAFLSERKYEAVDDHDRVSPTPDFAALVYTAYLTNGRDSEELSTDFQVGKDTPPIFFAHAFDDPHTCLGAVALFQELKRHGVPASLHVFAKGGHGFGGRDTGQEKDLWLPLCKAWLTDLGQSE